MILLSETGEHSRINHTFARVHNLCVLCVLCIIIHCMDCAEQQQQQQHWFWQPILWLLIYIYIYHGHALTARVVKYTHCLYITILTHICRPLFEGQYNLCYVYLYFEFIVVLSQILLLRCLFSSVRTRSWRRDDPVYTHQQHEDQGRALLQLHWLLVTYQGKWSHLPTIALRKERKKLQQRVWTLPLQRKVEQ